MPKCEKLVKLHKEKRPIFSRFQLEEQIDQIYEKRVPLPSGGSLKRDALSSNGAERKVQFAGPES
jgi:Ribonuclease G/E